MIPPGAPRAPGAADLPRTANAPNPNVQRLNAVIDELEEFRRENRKFKETSTKALRILREENVGLRAELAGLRERLDFTERLLDIEEEGGASRGEPTADGTEGDQGEGAAQPPTPATESAASNVQASIVARDADSIKVSFNREAEGLKDLQCHAQDVVNDTFKILMGLPAITKKHLPQYPLPGETWPKDRTTSKDCVRFDWYENAKHASNAPGCQQVFDSIRATGRNRVPDAIENLTIILDAHLMERIHTKFAYLATQYKSVHGKTKAAPIARVAAQVPVPNTGQLDDGFDDAGGGAIVGGAGEGDGDDEDEQRSMERGIRRTRALKVRQQLITRSRMRLTKFRMFRSFRYGSESGRGQHMKTRNTIQGSL